MKLALCLAVLTAAALPQQTPVPVRELRAALGGEPALTKIQRLHVKASFAGELHGRGDTELFVVLPDRLLRKSYFTQLSRVPGRPGAEPNPSAGFPEMTVERDYTSRIDGFAGSMPLPSGVPAPAWWTDEVREQSLVAGRFAYTRLIIPLLGTASTVTSASAIPGGIVFEDRDRTTWTLKLDASGRPATLSIEGHVTPEGLPVNRAMAPSVIALSDYRQVTGGLMWPHKFVLTSGGEILETTWIRSYEINGKTPKVLAK
jgi:hypothetical protein